MARRLSAPSPSAELQQQLDALLLEEGDDFSIVGGASAGVGGMTITSTPAPSAMSVLSGAGSGVQRSATAVHTPRFATTHSSGVARGGGQLSAAHGGGPRPPNSAAQALMRSAGSLVGGGGSLAESEFGVSRAGYTGKRIVRVAVVRNNDGVAKRDRKCFGFVGNGVGRKVCLSSVRTGEASCGGVKAHERNKWEWPFEASEAYAVPASSARLMGGAIAFVNPMIGVDEVTDEYKQVFESEKHTSHEWTEIILGAQQAWKQHLYTQSMEEEGKYAESGNDDNDSEVEEDDDSFVHMDQTHGLEEWSATSALSLPGRDVELLQEVPAGHPFTGALLEHKEALETHTAAFNALATKVPSLMDRGVDYVTPVISDLVTNLNAAVINIGKVAEMVGDVSELTGQRGHESVTDGVLAALELADAIGDVQAVWNELTRLEKLLTHLDDDVNVRVMDLATRLLGNFNPKLNAVIQRLAAVEIHIPANLGASLPVSTNLNPASSNPNPAVSHQVPGPITSGGGGSSAPPPNLHMSTIICKDDGSSSGYTLGSMIATLEAQAVTIDKLKADITAQGGIIFGNFAYPSQASLNALIRKEGVRNGRSCMAAIVDPVSIFVHDLESIESQLGNGWSATAKSMAASGINTETDRYYINSCSRQNVSAYHSGSEAPKAGKLISALSSMTAWNGEDGRDGAAQTIMTTLDGAGTKLEQHIQDNTPEGSELQRLAFYCAARSREFHSKFHDHVRTELIKLVQMGVPDSESLELMSEQFILMFNRFFEQRKLILQHRAGMDMVDYTTRVVWVTLKTHVLAAELLSDGLRNHPLLQNAFLRFLTKQTGQNVSSDLGPRIGNLEDMVNKEVRKLEAALKKQGVQLDKTENWKQGLLSKNDLKKP